MIGLSLRGFRDRWPLFAGAVVTVAAGVALVASAATIAASAAPPGTGGLPPHEAVAIREAFDGVATVMIISAILAGFLTVFIVATTLRSPSPNAGATSPCCGCSGPGGSRCVGCWPARRCCSGPPVRPSACR